MSKSRFLSADDKRAVDLQEVKQTIDQYEMLIQSLVSRSRDVPPLTMRSQRQIHAVPIVALCSYKYLNVCVMFMSIYRTSVFSTFYDFYFCIILMNFSRLLSCTGSRL